MNEENNLDQEDASSSSVSDPLRIEEEKEPSSELKPEGVSKRRSGKAIINYAIVATILILTSVALGLFKIFTITPCVLGVTILGMTFYSWKRRRDCNGEGIIFYSHSQILYYWPIWLGAFIISDITMFGDLNRVLEGQSFALPQVTLFHLIVMVVVIFFTSVNLRGVWAVVFAVSAVTLGLAFSVLNWWDPILIRLGKLELYVNPDFYRAMGVVIFIPWLFVVFVFDLRRYIHFMPSQITMVNEIGEGEKNFDSFGVVMEKHRDNYVQHMALGFGSGDLSIATHGGERETITFFNVLRINSVIKEVTKIRERRG